tara:strand:+ start:7707 stop:8600 length:894 start_codon:yes stop_codon:yes gene_type:complete
MTIQHGKKHPSDPNLVYDINRGWIDKRTISNFGAPGETSLLMDSPNIQPLSASEFALGKISKTSPSMDVGNLITGNDLAQNTAAINHATNIAQKSYLPGQQDIMVDGAPVANPDFGKAAPDLGPSISDQFAENVQQDSSFLQTKDSKGIDSGSSTQFNKGMGALGDTTAQLAAQTEDGTMSGGLSGLSTGLGAVSSLSMLGVGGMTTGVGAAAALTPLGIGVIAGSAILGAFMGSRKAKKARQAREKAERERKRREKEARTERVYTAKMGADQAAFANLQRAVSSALRRDNQVKIRT